MSYFEIVAGTYEEFLLGYKFNLNDPKLVQSFASHDHSSSIRSVAISGQYLASGAADDRIIIYDMKRRKQHCMLTHHDSTVNCLQFTDNHSHLISGSLDGVLAIVRIGNWQLEKVWDKAHDGLAILDVAVHSSGKLALTLGADCSLRTWNLAKGRQAFIVNLNGKSKDAKSLERIVWAEDGVRFMLYGGRYTEIWSIETGGILKFIEHNSKVSSSIWLTADTILVGFEDGELASVNITNLTRIDYKAHTGRIKSIIKYNNFIITASSNGEIKVWNETLKELASSQSGCRITCLGVMPLVKIKKEEVVEVEETNKETLQKPFKKRSVVVEVEECDDDTYIKYKNKPNDRVIVEESKLKNKKRKLQEYPDNSGNELVENSRAIEKCSLKTIKKHKIMEDELSEVDKTVPNKRKKHKNIDDKVTNEFRDKVNKKKKQKSKS